MDKNKRIEWKNIQDDIEFFQPLGLIALFLILCWLGSTQVLYPETSADVTKNLSNSMNGVINATTYAFGKVGNQCMDVGRSYPHIFFWAFTIFGFYLCYYIISLIIKIIKYSRQKNITNLEDLKGGEKNEQ